MRAAVLLLALVLAGQARAQAPDRPLTKPTRDVDVTYEVVNYSAPGGPKVLEQRMRWAVTDGKLRVDPPSPGLWIVMDYRTRRLSTVRDASRTVMTMDATGAAIDAVAPAAGAFLRRGEAQVAGLGCTEWQTKDMSGAPTVICLTADGVMLRAVGGGRVLLQATRVVYGPQDEAVFRMPDGYEVTSANPPAAVPRP